MIRIFLVTVIIGCLLLSYGNANAKSEWCAASEYSHLRDDLSFAGGKRRYCHETKEELIEMLKKFHKNKKTIKDNDTKIYLIYKLDEELEFTAAREPKLVIKKVE